MSQLIDRLTEEVLPDAPWEAIAPHYARGVVILVEGLTLPEAGAALALDDAEVVEQWLAGGILRRPSDDDARVWAETNTVFEMLVVQPWILITAQPGTE